MKSINTTMFLKMLDGGYLLIEKNLNYMNELNVFPVPDGDTGTNMKITIQGGIEKLHSGELFKKSFHEISKIFSRALALSARGNSGVIFSQIMAGFTSVLTAEVNEIDISLLKKCFKAAKEFAYAAVVQPVEGTMLSVVRLVDEELEKSDFKNIEDLFKKVVEVANETVKKTPQMLAELRHAGVVDSGGFGVARFFEGMYVMISEDYNGFTRNIVEDNITPYIPKGSISHIEHDGSGQNYGYCTEFLLNLDVDGSETASKKKTFVRDEFIAAVQKHAKSINLAYNEEEKLVRFHGHSLRPDVLLAEGLNYGEFINVKVENMNLQVAEKSKKDSLLKENLVPISIVVVTPSNELSNFIGDNYTITNLINAKVFGNPSVQEFMQFFRAAKAHNVVALMYDSNMVMSAEKAKVEMRKAGINVQIVCVNNFIEVLAACSVFDAMASLKANVKAMTKSVKLVASAVAFESSRTVTYPRLFVEKGDFVAMVGKKIMFKNKQRPELIKEVVKSLVEKIKEPELLLLVYGKNVPPDEVNALVEALTKSYNFYCKSVNGNQDTFDYFIGVQ